MLRNYSKYFQKQKEFKICARDLLDAPADAIVNPANSGLSHGGGVAAIISAAAGPGLDEECSRIIEKVGLIPMTFAVPTKSYNLPYKGIIHAVGPRMGDGDELNKTEKTIHNALIIAERRGWKTIAFPALGTGLFLIPYRICIEAFDKTVSTYWKENPDSSINLIMLCLTHDVYPKVEKILEELSFKVS